MDRERGYTSIREEKVEAKEYRRTFNDMAGEVMNSLNDLTANIVSLNDTFKPVLRKEREVTPCEDNKVQKEPDSEFQGFISVLFSRINDMNLLINELKDRSVL